MNTLSANYTARELLETNIAQGSDLTRDLHIQLPIGVSTIIFGFLCIAYPLIASAQLPYVIAMGMVTLGLILTTLIWSKLRAISEGAKLQGVKRMGTLAISLIVFASAMVLFPKLALWSMAAIVVGYFLADEAVSIFLSIKNKQHQNLMAPVLDIAMTLVCVALLISDWPTNGAFVATSFIGIKMILLGNSIIASVAEFTEDTFESARK